MTWSSSCHGAPTRVQPARLSSARARRVSWVAFDLMLQRGHPADPCITYEDDNNDPGPPWARKRGGGRRASPFATRRDGRRPTWSVTVGVLQAPSRVGPRDDGVRTCVRPAVQPVVCAREACPRARRDALHGRAASRGLCRRRRRRRDGVAHPHVRAACAGASSAWHRASLSRSSWRCVR